MRNDIHSPKNMKPENYTFKGSYLSEDIYSDLQAMNSEGIAEMIAETYSVDDLATFNWDSNLNFVPYHKHAQCDHCGARFKYGAVFTHNETGEDVIVGHICAVDAFHNSNEARAHDRMLSAVKAAKSRIANAIARANFLKDHPGLEEAFKVDHHIVQDIHSRFQQYCEISDKQIALVLRLAKEEADKKQRIADRDAAMASAPAIVAGRQTITGKILTFKHIDSQFGTTIKVLVENADGNRFFGTCPVAALSYARGQEIVMTATVEVKEPHFGLFSRPKLVTEKIEVPAAVVTKLLDEMQASGHAEDNLMYELINAENNQKGLETMTLTLTPGDAGRVRRATAK